MNAAPSGPAVEACELRKLFGATVAVDGLDLTVGRGEVFGFLGPNGAGKTTTINLMLGLVRPTSGSARVLGEKPGARAALARIGFLPEHFRFPSWLRADEFLDLHGTLYGMPAPERRRRVPELLERVGLGDRAQTRLGEFSKGMAQRIGLAQALLNRPELVVLDEPTSGLDPLGRRDVLGIIRELRNGGATVFLNSHLLSEVEATCDRVAVIKRGRVAQTGTLESLLGRPDEVQIRAESWPPALQAAAARWGRILEANGECLRLGLQDSGTVPDLTADLVRCGARILSVTPRRLSLEELFVRILGEDS